MNKFYIFIFTFLALGSISCDNDVNIVDVNSNTPVVYGLVSALDTVNYIRLEKTFADKDIGAIFLAKEEDQVYYTDATVRLINTVDNAQYDMERVEVSSEGLPRRTGDFLQNPNYLYKMITADFNLTEGTTYLINILDGNDAVLANSATTILSTPTLRFPRVTPTSKTIDFREGETVRFSWLKDDLATYSSIVGNIIIREQNLNTNEFETIEIPWNISSYTKDVDYRLPGNTFYILIASALTEKPGYRRQYIGMDFTLSTFDNEFGNYIDVVSANSGITGAQEVPVYTNIENGLGLFASTSDFQSGVFNISSATLDSLIDGRFTSDLGFTP